MHEPLPFLTHVASNENPHEDNHRLLRQLLDGLESAKTVHATVLCLDALRQFLDGHFAAEEEPGGFFDLIETRTPWLGERVDLLRAEHDAFLSSIDFIGGRLHDQPSDVIAKEVSQLVALLRAHEIAEGVLYQDAMAGPRAFCEPRA